MNKRSLGNRSIAVTYRGKNYRNLKELCEDYKIKWSTFRGRYYELGYSLEEAINEGKAVVKSTVNNGKRYTINNKYVTIKEVLNNYNINYKTFYKERYKNHLSLIDIIKKYKKKA